MKPVWVVVQANDENAEAWQGTVRPDGNMELFTTQQAAQERADALGTAQTNKYFRLTKAHLSENGQLNHAD